MPVTPTSCEDSPTEVPAAREPERSAGGRRHLSARIRPSRLDRPALWSGVWTAKCDSPTDFSSIAKVNPGIGFARARGATVHLRGPQTKATTLSCPHDTEYFGADFRLGAYLPMSSRPPRQLPGRGAADPAGRPDSVGRSVMGDADAAQNVDVFAGRLERAGLTIKPMFRPVRARRRPVAPQAVAGRTAKSWSAIHWSRRYSTTARQAPSPCSAGSARCATESECRRRWRLSPGRPAGSSSDRVLASLGQPRSQRLRCGICIATFQCAGTDSRVPQLRLRGVPG
jgi:hypothetical protein